MSTAPVEEPTEAIALIGMAGRFPKAQDVEEYWANLVAGRDCLDDLDDDELRANGVPDAVLRAPGYVRRVASLAGYDRFDTDFFGFAPGTAAALDPQQRLFLEVCWHALEDAAHMPENFDGATGVFAAGAFPGYLMHNLMAHHDPRRLLSAGTSTELVEALSMADANFFATRITHTLDLRGPALTVQTACSSSLVAVHLACQSLLSGECDLALAGGMTVKVPHRVGYVYDIDSMMSVDGRCRPFDARANGTVFGSGGGAVVLKRLSDAVADRDNIRAVIRGSAINNDGALKMGYSAPSVRMQSAVIAEALQVAGVRPADVGYIEAHGTGTALGDPVEMAALRSAFEGDGDPTRVCPVGSVKGNIGHLEAASGVAGLIKVVSALEHRWIPGTAHFQEPNPELRIEESAFLVAGEGRDWEPVNGTRIAGITSLGMGGTNAHIVVEQAPDRPRRGSASGPSTLVVSARTQQALLDAQDALADWLRRSPELDLADVEHTLDIGRRRFGFRRAVVAQSRQEAADLLEVEVDARDSEARPTSVVLVFPDEASDVNPAVTALSAHDPAFETAFEDCVALFTTRSGGAGSHSATVFAAQYALAHALQERGVRPVAVVGVGVGEYVAAVVAGALSLADAVALVSGEAVEAKGAPALIDLHLASLPSVQADQVVPDWAALGTSSTSWNALLDGAVADGSIHLVLGAAEEPFIQEQLQISTVEDCVVSFQWALARLWELGGEIDPVSAHPDAARVPLPQYPFQRGRHWVEPRSGMPAATPESEPRTSVPADPREALTLLWRETLGVDEVAPGDSFFKLGGDSVMATRLTSRARALGIDIRPKDLFDYPTFDALATHLTPKVKAVAVPVERPRDRGGVPLTPTQLWLLSAPQAERLTVPLVHQLGTDVDQGLVERALDAVLHRHGAMELVARSRHGIWQQHHATHPKVDLLTVQQEVDGPPDIAALREDMSSGPEILPIRAALVGTRAGRYLTILLHRAFVDRASVRVLADELATATAHLLAGREVTLPEPGSEWSDFAWDNVDLVGDQSVHDELDHWIGILDRHGDGPDPLIERRLDGLAPVSLSHAVSNEVHQGLLALRRREHVRWEEVVIAAAAAAWRGVAGRDQLVVDVLTIGRPAGRAGTGFADAVGQFSSVYPVAVPGAEKPEDTVRAAREAWRSVPRYGQGYGVLRHLHAPTAQVLSSRPPRAVLFAPVGPIPKALDSAKQALRRVRPDAVDGWSEPLGHHPVELRCHVSNGVLTLQWWYDPGRCDPDVVHDWSSRTMSVLDVLAGAVQ